MTSTKDIGCVEKPPSRIRTVFSKLAKPFVSVYAAHLIRRVKPTFPSNNLAPITEGPMTDDDSGTRHTEHVANQTPRRPYVGIGARPVDNFRTVNVYKPPESLLPQELAGVFDYFSNIKIVVLPPRDPFDQPPSMSAPNDNYQTEFVDAKFLSCKFHDGVAEFELSGRKPIGIRMSSETAFNVKEHYLQSLVTTKTVVTINVERVCKEISKCAGQKIIMIAVTKTDGKDQLSIFFDGGDALAVT